MLKIKFPTKLFGLLLDEAKRRGTHIPRVLIDIVYDHYKIPQHEREYK